MYKGKNVLCLIPARGGSKGLPKKNLLSIAGKPLVAHSIETAKKIKLIDEIYVSTEDKKIKKIVLDYGAKVIDRPLELATDSTNILDVFKHMIDIIPLTKEKNVILVIFLPTAPIRNTNEMKKCIQTFNEDNMDFIISVAKSKIRPGWLFLERNGFLEFLMKGKQEVNRQEQENAYYYLTGSIFVTSSFFLKKHKNLPIGGKMKKFLVDEIHALDIDTKLDFELCKFVMERSSNL